MISRQLRTQTIAKLVILYIQEAPREDDSFNGREQTLLSHIKGRSYSAMTVRCSSEQEARSLMTRCTVRGYGNLALRYVVAYPSIMLAELVHVYVRGPHQLAIVREFVDPTTPNANAIRDKAYYLVFCMQPMDYPDILIGIRKKWDVNP